MYPCFLWCGRITIFISEMSPSSSAALFGTSFFDLPTRITFAILLFRSTFLCSCQSSLIFCLRKYDCLRCFAALSLSVSINPWLKWLLSYNGSDITISVCQISLPFTGYIQWTAVCLLLFLRSPPTRFAMHRIYVSHKSAPVCLRSFLWPSL